MPQCNQVIICFSRRFPKMAEFGVVLSPKAADEDFRWWSSSMGPVMAPSLLVSTQSYVTQPSVPVTETRWVSLKATFAAWFLGWRLTLFLRKPSESKLHWSEEKILYFLWESECSSVLRQSGCEFQASVSGSSAAGRSTVGSPIPRLGGLSLDDDFLRYF